MTLYRQSIETSMGGVEVTADEVGIKAIAFVEAPVAAIPSDITRLAVKQLEEYFDGTRQVFELPLSPDGTEFQRSVWQALTEIPHGHTVSYMDIAKRIGNPKAVRAVGAANGKNPVAIVIPCHRVIGANGTLTGYAGGLDKKAALLALENPQTGFFS